MSLNCYFGENAHNISVFIQFTSYLFFLLKRFSDGKCLSVCLGANDLKSYKQILMTFIGNIDDSSFFLRDFDPWSMYVTLFFSNLHSNCYIPEYDTQTSGMRRNSLVTGGKLRQDQ